MDYNYAVKGDGQITSEVISSKDQKDGLKIILETISAKVLAIPKDKLKLFPPRAFGYGRTRESFKGKTNIAFDALSIASTASEMTLRLLLNPHRANRLIQQKSLDKNQLALDDVLKKLIDSSFKQNYKNGYLNEIQQMINNNVLKYIMTLAVSNDSYFQVKAIANEAINRILKYLSKKNNTIYNKQYVIVINEFKNKPENFKIKKSPKIPDGSPIGNDICNYFSN